MSGLVVTAEKCVGCRRCERVCANAGIEVVDRKAHVLDGCVSCGMCVDACPVGALSIEKDAAGIDLSEYENIWVFAQVDSAGAVLPVAYELLGKARELADERGCELVAVLGEPSGAGAADDDEATADAATAADAAKADANVLDLLAAGADEVIRTRDERLAENDAEVYAAWLCDLARERKPEVILYGATNFGRELAPRVAVLLQTGLTADCTILEMDTEKGLLQQTRPAFGGNLMATIVCPSHRPQMATVRPGIFPAPEPREVRSVVVEDVPLAEGVERRVRVLSREAGGANGSIADADVLVVVGRGVGSKKALAPVRRLVELLGERLGCKVEIGCTRPIVEAGWLDYSHQVGQTGVSVAPKLLLSLGVSGAIQHLAGISGAQTIVAVNDDPDAPIFGAAQYKVVGDCHAVVDELIEKLEA
ncbi:electron transfer flavoprotein subunit alpha [uncultured Parolsenella sp.]|uniref:electron transfer flavoprotein subunit alpha n=1 Tax=uncultured Parolsenella sp. TaxID=2083008 RepID=UPI0025F93063|nr:electron transfer flavoprotein subunit alpha [uncultured Parolsenella sp.]